MLSKIRQLSRLPQTNLTLRNLYNIEKYRCEKSIINNASFLKQEIPIRLARRTVELDQLKFGLAKNPSILNTRDLYFDSAARAVDHPEIVDIKSATSFKDLIKDIKDRHTNVVETMSRGIVDVSNSLQPEEKSELDEFLDNFYGSRIGIRTIIGQCVHVTEGDPGIIREINPKIILDDIIDEVKYICKMCYDDEPEFIFHGDAEYTFTYIPAFLQYIYLEVLKNAARATIENGNKDPIQIYQSKGKNDLIIKVSDLGGGFSRELLEKVYSYSYTTVKEEIDPNQERMPVIAGLGYGVPISRLYARYFGGDLQIIPYEGIGTDVIIYINRLLDSEEKEY